MPSQEVGAGCGFYAGSRVSSSPPSDDHSKKNDGLLAQSSTALGQAFPRSPPARKMPMAPPSWANASLVVGTASTFAIDSLRPCLPPGAPSEEEAARRRWENDSLGIQTGTLSSHPLEQDPFRAPPPPQSGKLFFPFPRASCLSIGVHWNRTFSRLRAGRNFG